MKSGRFFYPGRKDTLKAAIYVKDLVRFMIEMSEKEQPGFHLYNTVYTPCYTIEENCQSIAKVTDIKELHPSFMALVNQLGSHLIVSIRIVLKNS